MMDRIRGEEVKGGGEGGEGEGGGGGGGGGGRGGGGCLNHHQTYVRSVVHIISYHIISYQLRTRLGSVR